ncbi:MAG: hypothetical protein AAGG69_02260 [Pseudomonadota bacterium]
MPIARIADIVLRALERTATLYNDRVQAADGYEKSLTDEGAKLSQAIVKTQQSRKEALELRQFEEGELSETQKRTLMVRLETEIEATIAERVASIIGQLPEQCASCGAALPKLEVALQPAAAEVG